MKTRLHFLIVPLLLLASWRLQGAEHNLLSDSGAENQVTGATWDLTVYGAQPNLETHSLESHAGGRSLRVSSTEPSDAALGREIQLEPEHWYCFRGWVRTRGLDPHGARTSATLQVQRPGGKGIIAAGVNHEGDTEWVEVPVYFQAPADGRVRLCLFFVGFGKGTGTVWFEDISLRPSDLGRGQLRITLDPQPRATINPMQYGQFMEYLCDLVPSMWAEKLSDGSFEGLTPYKFVYLKETDFKEKPWYPSGQVNRAHYGSDRESKINGEVSQKILAPEGTPCTVGLSQDGIYVQKEGSCRFSVWLRAETEAAGGVPVRAYLHREGKILAETSFQPTTEWRKFSARLTPDATEANATLSIEFRGPGALWLDNASLMPEETVGGWRKDVVEAVRALHPGIIRFGGSVLDDPNLGAFEWQDTVGDPDKRKPFRAWGGLQKTEPGLAEIVQFCRSVGAEPLICLRFRGKAPKDAADEIEYFNGAVTTSMGAVRARDGHPEPYHVKYWQVGNEQASGDYDRRVAAFCRAIKKADPTVTLFSSFPNAAVIQSAGEYLGYVCPHHYTRDLAWMESNLDEVTRMIRENAPGRNIKIAVTEWNTTAGDAGVGRATLWGLANALACSRYQNLLHRHCDMVEIANRSNLANSFCSGIIQMDNHRLYKTPTYYAQELYATLAQPQPVRVESDQPANVGLDISATVSVDGKKGALFVVNDTTAEMSRAIDLTSFGRPTLGLTRYTLADRNHAGEPDVVNSFGDPERISVTRTTKKQQSSRFDYRFPPLSLTVLCWE